MAQTVRKGKRGKLRLSVDPPGAQIDVQDVGITVTSSDPNTVEALQDPSDPTLISWRTLTTGTTGPVNVTASVDADQDFGEVRLLDGRFDFDVVDSVTEPTAVSLAIEGPIEDDPPA